MREERLGAHVHAPFTRARFFSAVCTRARLHCSSVSNADKCVLLPSTYLPCARERAFAREKSEKERKKERRKEGRKEGNGAIKRQSQASNFQVICFHDAGKMFRFASFCRHVLAPYFQSQPRCCCHILSLSLSLSLSRSARTF